MEKGFDPHSGLIFTIPAFFLWAKEGVSKAPDIVSISVISLIGGFWGVFFMIPLRNALIVREHGTLPYPEGTACADVLLAGEKGGEKARNVFIGMGAAAVIKFIVDGFKIVPGVITAKLDALKTELSIESYPALIGVGYICGAKISSNMFAGGILGWFVLIPAIVFFGGVIRSYTPEQKRSHVSMNKTARQRSGVCISGISVPEWLPPEVSSVW